MRDKKRSIFILTFLILGLLVPELALSAGEQKNFHPLIGIPAPLDKESIAVNAAYVNAVIAAGGIPILIPQSENREAFANVMNLIDGLLLTGGEDLDPKLYNTPPSIRLETVNKDRDQFEWAILKMAVERKLPVLGICRGHQLITIYFGGLLYQDLPSEFDKPVCHRINASQPYTCQHEVTLEPGCSLEKIYGVKTITVNSQHHQAVKKLPPDFKSAAKSSDGGIEALHSDRFPMILSVQWHPEQLLQKGDSSSLRLFNAFIDLARKWHSSQNNR